jgi:hypothetical protein
MIAATHIVPMEQLKRRYFFALLKACSIGTSYVEYESVYTKTQIVPTERNKPMILTTYKLFRWNKRTPLFLDR